LFSGKTEPGVAAQLLQRQPAAAVAPPKPASATVPAGSDAADMEPVLLKKVVAGGRRNLDVLALVPRAVVASGAGDVSILLHLHGISVIAGHNYAQMLRHREVPKEYDMPAELQAVNSKPGARMIAVLPVGETVVVSKPEDKKKKYTVDFGGFDTDTLAKETIARLASEGKVAAGSSAGSVVLSAHSGGGFDAKGAAKGKKVAAMFAFESIHNDLPQYKALLEAKLDHDLSELRTLAAPADAAAAAVERSYQAQKHFLLEKGFRFVGFAGSNPGYIWAFSQLRDAIHGPGGWIATNDPALLRVFGSHHEELRDMMGANYQFNIAKKGNHFTVLSEGHLKKAMGALPATMGGGAQGGGTTYAPASAGAPTRAVKLAAAKVPDAKKPAPAPAAAAPPGIAANEPVITFGPNARKDAVAASSLAILSDILKVAGLTKATITSTARSADDQARAMYQNLMSAGVDAQRALYKPNGRLVIDTFEQLEAEGKSPKEVQDGMRDRINEIGPSKVSRHCGDFHVLNVFDVGPGSLGGKKARTAFARAAQAEVGKRVSNFIPWPKDPGEHLEIKPSGSGSAGGSHAPASGQAPATQPAAPAKAAPARASTPEKRKDEAFKKKHFDLSTKAVVVVKGQKAGKKTRGMAEITSDPATYCAEILRDAKIDPIAWFDSFTSGVKFLGRDVRDPIHTDLAEHLREVEGNLLDTYGGKDKSPAVAAKAVGLRDEAIVGARDHPTSAAVSMHLFGLALDVNYTANPFVGRGPKETHVLANAGLLVTGSPVGLDKKTYGDLHRVNSVLVEYLGYLDADTSATVGATLDAKLAAAKAAPWAGLKREDALPLIKADYQTITALWERKNKSQAEVIKKSGFMDLSKELVEGMKMSWGGAYGDIMHFDLRDQGQGREIHRAVGRYLERKKQESKEQYAAEHPK
jgi:hypothetical protein